MLIPKRILVFIMWFTYIILITLPFLWFFIPLIFGYDHEKIIDRYFHFINNYQEDLFNN